MSRIEQLIEELCPEGVEYITIEKVCKINRGRVMSKDYIRNNAGVYPVYSSQTANDGILGKIKTFDYDGEYLTWTTDGAYAGSVFYRKGKFSITNICGLLEVNNTILNPKFLLYYFSTDRLKNKAQKR
jgi:type I restriction enzyme S subunit